MQNNKASIWCMYSIQMVLLVSLWHAGCRTHTQNQLAGKCVAKQYCTWPQIRHLYGPTRISTYVIIPIIRASLFSPKSYYANVTEVVFF